MKVTDIKFLRCEVKEVTLHFQIKYEVFSVVADGMQLAVYMELSQQPANALKYVIVDAIKRRFGAKPENIEEIFKMVMKAWPSRKDHSVIQMY